MGRVLRHRLRVLTRPRRYQLTEVSARIFPFGASIEHRYLRRTGRRVYRHGPAPISHCFFFPRHLDHKKPYHTARRIRSLGLTPKLIPPPLNIIHTIKNDNTIPRQHALCPRIRNTPCLLLRSCMVIYRPGMRSIVRRDDVYFVP